MLLALSPTHADAQSLHMAGAQAAGQASQPAAGGEVIRLTAPDAIRMALENNLDLVAGQYEPQINDELLAQAKARVSADRAGRGAA